MRWLLLAVLLQQPDPLAVMDDRVRPQQDILDYHLVVSVPDSGSMIRAAVTITWAVRGGKGPLELDFDSAFVIDSVTAPEASPGARALPGPWVVTGDSLLVPRWGSRGDTLRVTLHYHGRPTDGLFIENNVHGTRSAFADNWPDRAHHWFPAEDHPDDKATVSFAIEVPAGWKAVANGTLEGVDTLAGGRRVWRWREHHPIPVYTMVFGAGRLAVTDLGKRAGIRHTVWTFPEDSAFAVNGPFRRVPEIVAVLARAFGPFPYEKLAQVQSSTRFGGMENSSAIFYAERPYASRTMREGVVAHETGHQWFGDAVTEADWHHLWLSEGFASYAEPLFYQLSGEDSTFRTLLENDRHEYEVSNVVDRPVIDTAQHDLFKLLNANNYPKGAWILHMLRGEVGDSAFFRGLRTYYATFRDSVALSSDFATIMERASGRSLQGFFRQWLLQAGYPRVAVRWRCNPTAGTQEVSFQQVQPVAWGTYTLGVPANVGGRRVSITLTGRTTSWRGPGCGLRLDPERDLLLEIVQAGPAG